MCSYFGHLKTNNFIFGTNGKIIIFDVPILSTLGNVHKSSSDGEVKVNVTS